MSHFFTEDAKPRPMKACLLLSLFGFFTGFWSLNETSLKAAPKRELQLKFKLANFRPSDNVINLPLSISQYESFTKRKLESTKEFGTEYSPTLESIWQGPINKILNEIHQVPVSSIDQFLRISLGGTLIFRFYESNYQEVYRTDSGDIVLANITLPFPRVAKMILESGRSISLKFFVSDNYLPTDLSIRTPQNYSSNPQAYLLRHLRVIDHGDLVKAWNVLDRRWSAYVFSICTRFSQSVIEIEYDSSSECWMLPAAEYFKRLALMDGSYAVQFEMDDRILNWFKFELEESSYNDLSEVQALQN